MVTALKIAGVSLRPDQKTLATITGLTQTRVSLLENGLAPSDSEALAPSVALGNPPKSCSRTRSAARFSEVARTQPQPPPSYEPEQSLLGAILVRPEVLPAVIDIGVKAESFSGAGHGLIFKAMLALHREQAPVDLVTVSARLKEWGKLQDAGGAVFLAGLSEQLESRPMLIITATLS